MREIKQSIHTYIRETGNEGKPRPQPLQHEDMNQPFQTVQCTPTIPHAPYFPVKSAKFADSDVRRLNTTMVEGPPASSSTPSSRASVCCPSTRYQTAGRHDTLSILSATLCSTSIYIPKTRFYTKTKQLQVTMQDTHVFHTKV